jgi:uncharacterized protein
MAWVGLMAKLTDLGFSKGILFETIVSTYNPNGTPNAAPMGAIMQDPQTISLNLFNSSLTSRNLETNRCAVINLTCDIEVFYKTAFKEANPDGKLPQEFFEKAEVVNAPKLRLADVTIDVTVVDIESVGTEKTKFLCNVERINTAKICPHVYCRAMPLTLEAIIHATRVKAFVNDKKQKKNVSNLLKIIENCNNIVNHTAPNSKYSAVMADLMKRIDSWRNKP